MTQFRSKRPRLRLDSESYRRLRQQVLERDRWCCQLLWALYRARGASHPVKKQAGRRRRTQSDQPVCQLSPRCSSEQGSQFPEMGTMN